MSEDSELSAAAGTIQETVSGTFDADEIESMLTDDRSPRAVGRELGTRVGRELGAVIGRELGAVVAIDVRERKGPRAILSDVKRRLVELVRALLRNVDVESAVSRLVGLGKQIVPDTMPDGPIGSSLLEETLDTDEAADEGDTEEAGEAADEEAEEVADEEAADSSVSAEELQSLREETYRELLEVMSYQELQSIAKEVGVKANLSQEEMTERIIEEFSSSSDQ